MTRTHRDDQQAAPSLQALEVHTRTTVGRGGQRSSDPTVYCPRREQSLTMIECVLCPDCDGVHQDGSGTQVLCRHPAEEPTSPARRTTSAARLPLAAVMTRDVVCVTADMHLSTLAALLVDRGFTGVPVVDDQGRAIGVVSRTDLVRARVDDPGCDEDVAGFELDPGFHLEPDGGARVADVMMPIVFTLPENATLSQAAAIMAYEGIHRVPVVTTTGAVVGIVTSMDVVRWLAENDGYITRPWRAR